MDREIREPTGKRLSEAPSITEAEAKLQKNCEENANNFQLEEQKDAVTKFEDVGLTKEAAEGLLLWIEMLHEQGKIDNPNIVYTGIATILIGDTPTTFVVFMTEDNTTYYAHMAMNYYPPYEIFKNVIADDCCIYWSGEYNPTS